MHHLVALELARWISSEFSVWANTTLWHVINNNYLALTPEAEQAKQKVQSIWQEIRDAGKITRRTLTDAIKDWFERNPNAVYQALWGLIASELEKLLGCERHQSRDYMDSTSLKLLDRAEANVCDFIDMDNIKPVDAVPLANIRKAKFTPARRNDVDWV